MKGFEGYLQVDGYAGYHSLEKVELVGRIAHARRKFDEALKSLPAHDDKKEATAAEGLHFCNQLFKIERRINEKIENCMTEQRKTYRLEHSQPILDAFLIWLKSKRPQQVPPKSKFWDAITYCINGLS